MGTSVVNCRLCRKYYREILESGDKRRFAFLALVHKHGHEKPPTTGQNAPQDEGVGD